MDAPHQDFRRALTETLLHWDLAPAPAAIDLMEAHFHAMIEANRTINLTRITEPVDAAIKHYADSLSLLRWVRERQIRTVTVVDVGTGAGFPAIPLAAMRPDWQITAIDGTAKKVAFVRRVSEVLGLHSIKVVHAHSAHWSGASPADLVLARAVGRLSKCMHQMAVHVRSGGHLIAYKTLLRDDDAELLEAQASCVECGLRMTPPHPYELVLRGETISRVLYPLQKQTG